MPSGRVTAQTFSTLHSFITTRSMTNSDGAGPSGGLILSGSTLYGTALVGGSSSQGTVFAVNTDGTGFTTLHDFTALQNNTNSDGAQPMAGLILSSNTLYGTASVGGNSGNGTVFAVNTDGTGFTVLHSFTAASGHAYTNSDGAFPYAGLILSGNTLYGTALGGGRSGAGTVFAVKTDGTDFTVLHTFGAFSTSDPLINSDGTYLHGGLLLSGNTLYGTAEFGGRSGLGTVFKLNTDGTGFTNLHHFTATSRDGATPAAGLVLSGNTLYGTGSKSGVFKINTDGTGFTNLYSLFGSMAGLTLSGNTLFGTTEFGVTSGFGTVFKLSTDGTGFTNLHNFVGAGDGFAPVAGLILSGNTLYGTALGGGSSGGGTVFAVNTDGMGFTTLHSFVGSSDGAFPQAGLILSSNTLYGTASSGGSSGPETLGAGTVFKVNTDGTGFTNIYSFTATDATTHTNSDGANPLAKLTLSGNTLYGTASKGGSSSNGTVFAVNIDGTSFTTLHSFTTWATNSLGLYTNSDGAGPEAGLILSGNSLYGVAAQGGSAGFGTLFTINTDGTGFTTLHNFTALKNSTNSDGAYPAGGLMLSGNTLYGATFGGGSAGYGMLFKVNTEGTGFTNLHSFTAYSVPTGDLILSGNTLYGTAASGGSARNGTVFKVNVDGAGFTNLHSFTALLSPTLTNTDGAFPSSGLLLLGTALFGTAERGGRAGNGTVFKINTDGTGFTNLHSFTSNLPYGTNSDGVNPSAGLILSSNTLYGTASYGGSRNGTVFSLSLGAISAPQLTVIPSGANIILTWPTNVAGFTLQSTPALTSTFTNIPGATSPYTNAITGAQQFFRLISN